jgi:hypothetical protein
MVKDAFSDNNDRPLSTTDGLGRNSDHELPRSPVSDLTQELARLLAASIAQNQANTGRSGIPTNAELINLANLLSAAAAQRVSPPFKDGLSSLSYGQPPPVPRQQHAAASSSLEFGHDDEQMPIPSTWRQSLPYDDDHWFRHQMGAAVLGLIAGLMIVVPAVLWLSGIFGQQRSGSTAARTSPFAIESSPSADKVAETARARPVHHHPSAEKPSESAAQYVIGSLEPQRGQPFATNPTPPSAIPVSPAARLLDPNKPRIEALLAEANQRIESGNVIGAREMLAGADDGTQGAISFALAETYDPNMLAAWGIRAMLADAAKARELYHMASGLGVAGAQRRLDGLR